MQEMKKKKKKKKRKEMLRKGKFVEMETRLMFEWGGDYVLKLTCDGCMTQKIYKKPLNSKIKKRLSIFK